ncbi:centromere/kinetochore protein zw10 like protein [Ditylenchus destructor]|nr:centromere/kinetochore protein zw10 like protein [Ditylenchus destructor]
MQIGQVANVWREVMSEFVLTHSLGCLVSHLLTILSDIILAKQDIKASDADIMVRLLTDLMERLKDILTINRVEVIHRVCEEPYFKVTEIIFCLNASLAEIGHRWCEGKGPLAMWLKPEQVTKLVRALFQNTERRRELLSHIN